MRRTRALLVLLCAMLSLAAWLREEEARAQERRKTVRELKLIIVIGRVEDAEFCNSILREDDIVATYGAKRWLLEKITRPEILVSRQSIADLRREVTRLPDIRIDYINYNPEQWQSSHTPAEGLRTRSAR